MNLLTVSCSWMRLLGAVFIVFYMYPTLLDDAINKNRMHLVIFYSAYFNSKDIFIYQHLIS